MKEATIFIRDTKQGSVILVQGMFEDDEHARLLREFANSIRSGNPKGGTYQYRALEGPELEMRSCVIRFADVPAIR